MTHKVETYGSLRCVVSVPPGEPPPGGWPVLVFLHGAREAAPADIHKALTAHGPLNPESAKEATQRFIVVAPQLPAPGGDVWRFHADAMEAIARAVAAAHHGNPTKLYLTGFSFGANGVLDIGSRQPHVWAALWPVDPTNAPTGRIDPPIWVSAGEHSRGGKPQFVTVLGVEDRAHQAASQRIYDDAGVDHVATATTAYRDKAIYEWLLRHQTPGGPDGQRLERLTSG